MSEIVFKKEEKEVLVAKLKEYLLEELDCEVGQFDAEFLLEFFSKEIGIYHYNKGLKDAQEVFRDRTDTIINAIYELEVDTEFSGNEESR